MKTKTWTLPLILCGAGLMACAGDPGADGAPGAPGQDGAPGLAGQNGVDGVDGTNGQACWDLDGDGQPTLATEDTNGDGTVDIADCRGLDGQDGVDGQDGKSGKNVPIVLTDEQIAAIEARAGTTECMPCHKAQNPNMWQDYLHSRMAAFGEVTCENCHPDNPDITQFVEGHRSLPRPETCAVCHPQEFEGHRANRHSVASIRNYECGRFDDFPRVFGNGSGYHFNDEDVRQLQDIMDGNGPAAEHNPTVIATCQGCHNIENRCDSCHTRHRFSKAEARHPDACATCHMGPDHPQHEMYKTSKHGTMYASEGDTQRVPVCVDCHMPFNGKIFDKKVDANGNEYTDHNMASTIAYGPVGGGTTRKGFTAQNGRVRMASREPAGVAQYDEVWFEWADGKVYTTPTSNTVAYEDILIMSLEDYDDNGKQDYGMAQPADDTATLAAARGMMLDVCKKCHSASFSAERLLVADLIHENTKKVHMEALDLVVALAAADIGPYSTNTRPTNPETGNNGWAANMKIRNLTQLERDYFHIMKYDQVKTWKGAYHFNPDYTHWYGWTESNLKLGQMGDIATDQVLLDLWIAGTAYPGATGNIFDDGLYQGIMFVTGNTETQQVQNYYDKYPGAGDTTLDFFTYDAVTGRVSVGADNVPDHSQPIDVDMNGTLDFVKTDANGGALPPGVFRAVATGRIVTFH